MQITKSHLKKLAKASRPLRITSYILVWLIQITVECRYNAVQFITLLATALYRQQQNLSQTSNSPKTPHTSPSRASYGVSVVILKKTDHVITATPCTLLLQFHTIPIPLPCHLGVTLYHFGVTFEMHWNEMQREWMQPKDPCKHAILGLSRIPYHWWGYFLVTSQIW